MAEWQNNIYYHLILADDNNETLKEFVLLSWK